MPDLSPQAPPKGTVFIVAAPSGAGKTSLVNALVASTPGVCLSISHTTRPHRPGEQEGEHYHFVDRADFQAMVDAGAFLEHAEVFGNLYGTGRAGVLERAEQGDDVILEIDWQGARQVRAALPDAVGIFILPPSRLVLEQRLHSRAQDSDEVIAERMREARDEIAHHGEFDYLVVNDQFETALSELRTVVLARRLRREVQHRRLAGLVAELLA